MIATLWVAGAHADTGHGPDHAARHAAQSVGSASRHAAHALHQALTAHPAASAKNNPARSRVSTANAPAQ
jgi:hypothetical protein